MTDVFIIGGGPAGLAAGIAARKKGFTVTVADGGQLPLDKACGEGMMPGTLSTLRDLGIRVPLGAGSPFCGIHFINGGSNVRASFPTGIGIGMRRPLLHRMMLKAAIQSGVAISWNTPVSGIVREGVVVGKTVVPARWIIGADGSQSLVRRWCGLDSVLHYSHRFARRRHFCVRPWSEFMEIHWGRDLQAYVTPVAADEVCVVLISRCQHILWEEAWAQFPNLSEQLGEAPTTTAERGSITAMHSLRRVYRGNVALLGDASGGVDAITGEGLRLGFRQALALADAMEANDLRLYQTAHRQLARRPSQMGKLMLHLGNYAGLRERVVRALASHPAIFARFLAIHVGEISTAQLATTAALLGWRLLAA